MPRSVNAVASRARRKKVLKLAKGNFGSRGNVWTVAYSEFIGKVNAKGIAINRKVMADLAMNEPKAFEAIVKAVK